MSEELDARIRALERQSRALARRLERSEQLRSELEAGRDKRELLLRDVIRGLGAAEEAARRANEELEARVAQRTDELSRANTALAQARDEAVAANQAKSRFLANMSHELRTPLNAIIGYAELVLDETSEPGPAEDLRRIAGAGRHLLALISDILDLSKIEAGHAAARAEVIEVAALVYEVVATIHPLVRANHNALHVEIDPDVGAIVSDAIRLRQVLFNLLSNAAKFTERGTITVRAARGAGTLRLEVEDTGIGIAAEHLPRLFSAFTQADDSPTRRYGGTGLGLALTRASCELLGGAVSVRSELGRGSTFTVELPA